MFAKLRSYRTHVAATLVAAGLVSTAAAFDLFDQQLVVVVPVDIVGGNPINGYVIGLEDNCVLDMNYGGTSLLPPPPPPSGSTSGSSTTDPDSGTSTSSSGSLLSGLTGTVTSLPVQRISGNTNPLNFTAQTTESMAPGIMTFNAHDSDESATASTRIK